MRRSSNISDLCCCRRIAACGRSVRARCPLPGARSPRRHCCPQMSGTRCSGNVASWNTPCQAPPLLLPEQHKLTCEALETKQGNQAHFFIYTECRNCSFKGYKWVSLISGALQITRGALFIISNLLSSTKYFACADKCVMLFTLLGWFCWRAVPWLEPWCTRRQRKSRLRPHARRCRPVRRGASGARWCCHSDTDRASDRSHNAKKKVERDFNISVNLFCLCI